MALNIGLDLGSTALKIVVLGGREIIFRRAIPTVPGQDAAAKALLRDALVEMGRDPGEATRIAATGYGKKLLADSERVVDEISANALGAFRLSGGAARVVVNIGGQDMKVIFVGGAGEVLDFKMNDKCAAGAGRFFEQAARILDTPLERFAELACMPGEVAELNSTCVVFAESEMVSLLARGTPRENIIRGLCLAVARRAASFLGSAGDLDGVYLDGGPAMNRALADALAEELLVDVGVLPYPQFTVAAGAAYGLEG